MGTLVSKEELIQSALDFLKKNNLMVLGTSSDDKVWSATVGFAVTEDLEIIFYSKPTTRHGENIEKNPYVSVVVTEVPVKKKAEKSVQLSGTVRKADGAEWDKYYKVFEEKHKWAKEVPDYIIYVITPNEGYMINEKLLGHHNRIKII